MAKQNLVEKEIRRHLMVKNIQERKDELTRRNELRQKFLNLFKPNTQKRLKMEQLLSRADLPRLIQDLGYQSLDELLIAARKGQVDKKMDELIQKNKDHKIFQAFLKEVEEHKQPLVIQYIKDNGVDVFLENLGEKSMEDLLARILREKEEDTKLD